MTKSEMKQFAKRRLKIARWLSKGISQAEIARRLGVKRQRIQQITVEISAKGLIK